MLDPDGQITEEPTWAARHQDLCAHPRFCFDTTVPVCAIVISLDTREGLVYNELAYGIGTIDIGYGYQPRVAGAQ